MRGCEYTTRIRKLQTLELCIRIPLPGRPLGCLNFLQKFEELKILQIFQILQFYQTLYTVFSEEVRRNMSHEEKRNFYSRKEVFRMNFVKKLPWRGLEPPRMKQLILNQRCLPFHHQGLTI